MTNKIRNLNVNEYISWIISRSTAHNVLMVSHIDGLLEMDSMQRAWRELIKKNAILNYTICIDQPRFILLDAVQPNIKFIKTSQNWAFYAEEEVNNPFVANECLARITVLELPNNETTILFCFHHVIGDVYSAFYLMSDLLKLISFAEKEYKRKTNKLPNDIKIYPRTEYRKATCKKNNNRTGIAYLSLNKNELDIVIQKSKINSSTVTGFLAAASTCIMRPYVKNSNTINITIGVNARKDGRKKELAFVTSWLDFIVNIDNGSIHTLAYYLSNEIKTAIIANTHEKNLKMTCDLINATTNDEFLHALHTKPTDNYFFISSMGRFDFQSKRVKLKEVYALASCQAHMQSDNSFFICVTSLNNVGMFLTLSYPANYMKKTKANNILNALKQELIK